MSDDSGGGTSDGLLADVRQSPSAEELRVTVQRADEISLFAAARAVREATDLESRDTAQKAYIEFRTALIVASRHDREAWGESGPQDETANHIARRLFRARIVTTYVLIGVLFAVAVVASLPHINAGQYVPLIASLAGIGIGWMFGATVRQESSKTNARAGKKGVDRG